MVKYFKIALALGLLVSSIMLIRMIFVRMQVPYEDGVFYDPHTGTVYKEPHIFLCCLLLLASISAFTFVVRSFWKENINDFLSQKTYIKKS